MAKTSASPVSADGQDLRERWRTRLSGELRFVALYVPFCLLPSLLTLSFGALGWIDARSSGFAELMGVTSLCLLALAYQLYRRQLDAEAARLALEQLVRTDHLTGLGNRRALWEALEREAGRAHRMGSPTCVLLIDLDRFKAINDQHGHATGDRVLAHFAELLKVHTRAHQDELFRIGGDEFVVLLPATRACDAMDVATRIREQYIRQVAMLLKQVGFDCSAGVAELGLDEPATAWLGRADGAMYDAKKKGGGALLATDAHATPDHQGMRPLDSRSALGS